MAVDQAEVLAAPANPVEPPEAQPASPPTDAPSRSRFEHLTSFFRKGEGEDRVTDTAPVETPPVERTISPEPTTPAPTGPYRQFGSQEELDRFIQSQNDRAIDRHEKQRAEELRQGQVNDLETQLEAATEAEDWAEIARLNKDLLSLKKGERIERQSSQQLQQLRAEAQSQAIMETAAKLDGIYMDPITAKLPPAAQGELKDWFAKEAKSEQHTPESLRAKYAERTAAALYEHGLAEGRNQVLHEIDTDPQLKKLVTAHVHGGTEEPPHLSAEPEGGPVYTTFDDLRIAHAEGAITNAQYRRLAARFS